MTELAKPRRKKYADYLTVTLDVDAKWVTDGFVRDRRICLYGVGVALTQAGRKLSLDPIIPCAGPLCDLVRKYPKAQAFKFDRKKRKWRLT
jgi:hypothetical protein